MTIDEQKDLFKTAIKQFIPIINPQQKDALDFADKSIELGNAFNRLRPYVQQSIIKAFINVAMLSYPLQFNPHYNRN